MVMFVGADGGINQSDVVFHGNRRWEDLDLPISLMRAIYDEMKFEAPSRIQVRLHSGVNQAQLNVHAAVLVGTAD
jgi:hypothetical protein